MQCPYCGFPESKVTDSRTADGGIRRRRECQRCGLRFTTSERLQAAALLIGKRDGRREEFNRDKLTLGIRTACAKRPISFKDVERTVDEIEGELQKLGRAEVPSLVVGEMVVERLKQLDRVAYIRFASVYRAFADVESFEKELIALKKEPTDTGQLTLLTQPEIPINPNQRQERPRRNLPHTIPFPLQSNNENEIKGNG